MNKNFKNLLVSLLFVLCLTTAVFAKGDVKLWINGNFVDSDVAPVIENNRTLVPIRIITENLGYEVSWNQKTKEVSIIQNEDNYFTFVIGEKGYYGGDIFNDTNVAPKIIDNRTFVPLRIIAEVTGNKVDWDSTNKVAIIGEGYVADIKSPEIKKPKSVENTEIKERVNSTDNNKPVKASNNNADNFNTYNQEVTSTYVGNSNTNKFHIGSCKSAKKISPNNRVGFSSREEAVNAGYVPCKRCNP